MNKKLVQSYLDRAAEELDEAGFRDLADKVDAFNAQLMASDDDAKRQKIATELSKIDREVSRRTGEAEEPEEEDTRATRIASLRRRMAIRRRLKAKIAERAEQGQENLARARRMARLARARREEESVDEDGAAERRAAIRRRLARRLAK